MPSAYSGRVTLIGYARCSTDRQDLALQHHGLRQLGVEEDRIYTDQATGRNLARPGLTLAMAAARAGDVLVVTKMDRLARSVVDAHKVADSLRERGISLQMGSTLYDPDDPMGRMFFNILATFAEFEADLIRMRTREGMAIARQKGLLRGKPYKLSEKRQEHLVELFRAGEHTMAELAELFDVSRATVYRVLRRARAAA